MTTQTLRRSDGLRRGGLDWTVPNDGKAADAYAVAVTCLYLNTKGGSRAAGLAVACHATRLHVISGLLHRLSERQCNEDLTCRECDGRGWNSPGQKAAEQSGCKACAGTGSTVGRREKSLEADAQEIAQHYGLTCYFQGDPRGCSLYIGEAEALMAGHAVVRLGR